MRGHLLAGLVALLGLSLLVYVGIISNQFFNEGARSGLAVLVAELNEDLMEKRAELNAVKTELENINRSLSLCQEELSTCQEDLEDYRRSLRSCREELSSCRSDSEACQEDLTTCQEDLATYREDLNSCQEELSTCQEDLEDYRRSLRSCRRRLDSCRDDYALLKEYATILKQGVKVAGVLLTQGTEEYEMLRNVIDREKLCKDYWDTFDNYRQKFVKKILSEYNTFLSNNKERLVDMGLFNSVDAVEQEIQWVNWVHTLFFEKIDQVCGKYQQGGGGG